MAFVNDNYCNLKDSYLFSQIAQKVNAYVAEHPEKKVIRMGIGDVTLPLAPAVIDAMQKAVAEMGVKETFRGYGPEQGYDFLHEAIVKYYAGFGVTLASDEIFISDGAKSDCGNITDIFSNANTILIPDPVYPVYLDTNIMCGRKIVYMDGKPENNFLPMPDDSVKADIIYLCSPNPAIPRSIFVVEDARKCAIELCSLSKTAGFTGTRCGYTVVPHALVRKTESGKELELNKMWLRRQTTKFNGVPYIIQRGAEAVFSEQGQKECREMLAFYKENARIMAEGLRRKGIKFYGGTHSPYIWLQCPQGMSSWEFFDFLLEKLAVVGTPGAGFGAMGEGYFRLSAFGSRENTIEAMERIEKEL